MTKIFITADVTCDLYVVKVVLSVDGGLMWKWLRWSQFHNLTPLQVVIKVVPNISLSIAVVMVQ